VKTDDNRVEPVGVPVGAAGTEVDGARDELRIAAVEALVATPKVEAAGSEVVTAAVEVETAGPEVTAADADVTTAPPGVDTARGQGVIAPGRLDPAPVEVHAASGGVGLTLTMLRLPGPKSFRAGTRLSLPVTKCSWTNSRFACRGQKCVSP
jgi:hypothetical protein